LIGAAAARRRFVEGARDLTDVAPAVLRSLGIEE